jgi:hypothetical protein
MKTIFNTYAAALLVAGVVLLFMGVDPLSTMLIGLGAGFTLGVAMTEEDTE